VEDPTSISFAREGGAKIKFMTAGMQASGAVSENGRFFTWGDGCEGQLGLERGGVDPTFHHYSDVMRTYTQTTPKVLSSNLTPNHNYNPNPNPHPNPDF